MATIPAQSLQFLKELKENNTKDWMDANRARYKQSEAALKEFYAAVQAGLNKDDVIEKLKVFRINRDIRFSKDKTPYNAHRSASFSREGASRRGGYYLRIQPGASAMAGGFWAPEPADLLRIRKEFEQDAGPMRAVLEAPAFKKAFGGLNTEFQVKTAPKGFSKDHPNIDLIKNKAFFVVHPFTDKEVLAPDFADKVVHYYSLLRPYFDLMTEILTTDLNGVSLID
ncbi:MAG: DUF2461 domain-containing protein [Gilvibacter sp.]